MMNMKNLLFRTLTGYFVWLIFIAGCNRPDGNDAAVDPFLGLPVIETGEPVDINGETAGSSGDFFFVSSYFADMEISETGHLFAYSHRSPAILHFDASGRFLGRVGGQGQGPGEYQGPPSFDINHRDSLFVLDGRSWTVSLFVYRDNQWDYADSFLLEKQKEFQPEEVHQLDNEHLAVVYEPTIVQIISAGEDQTGIRKRIDIVTAGGEPVKEHLLHLPISRFIHYTVKSGGSSVMQNVPYGARSIVKTGPGGRFYHLNSDTFRISIYGRDGRLIDSIRHSDYSVALGDKKKREAVEEQVKVNLGSDSENRTYKDRVYEEIPDRAPLLSAMHVDRDTGHIIVGKSDFYQGPNWLLLDPDGNRIGVFNLDPSMKVTDFRNGKIVGALMDEDTPPTIRVVSLPKSAF